MNPARRASQARPSPGRRRVVIMLAMLATVGLLAAAVVGAVMQLRHDSRGPAAAGHKAVAAPRTVPASGQASASPRPSRSASKTSSPARAPAPGAAGVTVAISPAVAGNPAAARVRDFLSRYFTAINDHDYQAYAALLGQGLAPSQKAAFTSGYGSTTDSGAVLAGLSDQAAGQLAASVTFTSHQQPANSPDGSSCDDWSITLYLVPHADSYVIGSPPSTYGATHHAC
jgi:hypothetical protein